MNHDFNSSIKPCETNLLFNLTNGPPMYTKKLNNSWLVFLKQPSTDVKCRLIGFHHAGGSASFFNSWKNNLPDNIELLSIQLPGRENRIGESPYLPLSNIVNAIYESLILLPDKPFIFFGHSLGGLIAFEVAKMLVHKKQQLPKYFIVSGHRPPHIASDAKKLHLLPDHEFIHSVNDIYQGINDEILNNQEFLDLLIPRLRADISLTETYHYCESSPLPIPIHALCGQSDPTISPVKMLEWSQHTMGEFSIHVFSGDHFFINTSKPHILKILQQLLI